MIPKHIEMKNVAKSNVVRLVSYITSDQKKAHRVGEVFITNCKYEDTDLASREMLLTQLKNRRAKSDKSYHLMVSFRPGEDPTSETIRRVETELCKRLGFAEHQRIAVVHCDTNSVHMHVAINKIHPKRFRIHDPYMDHFALGKECERLERQLFLRTDNHTPTGKTKAERKAGDIEAITGQQSLLTYMREECVPALKEARTWEDFHRVLAKAGLSVKLQGNGVNFIAASGARTTGSGVDRSFSKRNLEERFGEFCPAPKECKDIVPEKTFQSKPLGPDNSLKEEFAQAKESRERVRLEHLSMIRDQHSRRVESVRVEIKMERQRAKRIPAGRTAKRKLYDAINTKYRHHMRRIREESRHKRQIVYQESPRQNWLAWLQQQAEAGRPEALEALRGRAFGLAWKAGAAIRGEKEGPNSLVEGMKVDFVTKRGTVIYSVGRDALRDDGDSFRVAREASMETVIMALKIAKKRFGDPLELYGDSAFRNMIVKAAVEGSVFVKFADPFLEKRRQILSLGKTQSAIRERESPGHEM